jgi:hypothetical protein
MNLRVVKDKKKTQQWEPKEISLYRTMRVLLYWFTQRLNCSRHRVHYLASKSDSILLRKVQSQKLHILI